MRIGIDVGGTFTDFLLTLDNGSFEVYKVLTTPEDPSSGLINGISEMAKAHRKPLGEFITGVSVIVHGTTVTTNAVLTRGGARTGLITTKGLRDALEMRRGIREEQYNNRFTNVEPLVPRHLRMPVGERLDYKGDIITPMNKPDVKSAVRQFKKEGVESVAICFMNSFANKKHERAAAEIVRKEMPGAYLTVSSALLPSIRFYDRISTTALNSYVGPILRRYLNSLVKKLKDTGFNGALLIMQSNGGVVSPEIAAETAGVTLLSGPAGGPVAGLAYTAAGGYNDFITVDMGGTSFDAALIKNRNPVVTTEGEVDRLRLAMPMLNIVTIGAGGGSIGWIDQGGLLKMGPKSAGANPGPACYGRGGKLPACTDADLVLGYLDEDYFAGGRMKLDRRKAEEAIRKNIAEPLKLTLTEAAAGMYHVINVNMASGVREVSVKRGHDPRDFPMVVAGGAGPIHSCQIALELEIPVMIVPRESSIFCAAGMLMSDLKHDFVNTYATPLKGMDLGKLRRLFKEMEAEGAMLLRSENIPGNRIEYMHSLDMRYLKQYHEVNVRVTKGEIAKGRLDAISSKFHPEHDRLFGYSLPDAPIELINLRLQCVGRTDKPKLVGEKRRGGDASGAIKGRRKAYLPGKREFEEIPVYDADKLHHGNMVEGPAIMEQVNTSTFLTPEYSLVCDRYGSYTLYLKDREREVLERVLP